MKDTTILTTVQPIMYMQYNHKGEWILNPKLSWETNLKLLRKMHIAFM